MSTEIGPLLDYLSPLNKAVEGKSANTWRPDDPEYRADGYRQITASRTSSGGCPTGSDPRRLQTGHDYGLVGMTATPRPVLTPPPRSESAALTAAEVELIDAYWRAANYLCGS